MEQYQSGLKFNRLFPKKIKKEKPPKPKKPTSRLIFILVWLYWLTAMILIIIASFHANIYITNFVNSNSRGLGFIYFGMGLSVMAQIFEIIEKRKRK